MLKQSITILSIVFLMVFIACLSEKEFIGPPPSQAGGLVVGTGITETGFGDREGFTVSWNEVEGANYYEVRIFPLEITSSNWDNAVLVATVPAVESTDSVLIDVQPEVFTNTCIGCGLCVEACPHDAITLEGNKAVIDLEKCTSCGECVRSCPVQAISNSCYGESYYFAVRAFSGEGNPSGIVCTSSSYRLRYMNWEKWCGRCEEECFILLDTCGPGCPVDAVWYEGPDDPFPGMIHIDTTLCIQCGQCYIQCHEYGLWSIRREVVED